MSLEHGHFRYYPTNEERDKDSNFIVTKVRNFFLSLYWVYYIHLPYYLMNSEDAFILHSFFLSIFTLSLYALFAYLPQSLFHLFDRFFYYVTGDDFKHQLIKLGVQNITI